MTDEPNAIDDEIPAMRNEKEIDAAYSECWDKVWWNRHHEWPAEHLSEPSAHGSVETRREIRQQAEQAAARIEEKYGRENLAVDDLVEAGKLLGRLSALSWVLGCEWDGSLDT
jgi:hypothetical protein